MPDTNPANPRPAPAIILVQPQLGENIGMVARAMNNCALGELRLVRPRDGWPSAAAVKASSGSEAILEAARLYDSTEAAVADLNRVYATTARLRGMTKPIDTPRKAAASLRAQAAAGERCGVLFGPERSGLTNDDVVLAERVIEVPLNPAFTSLNLAQAVLLLGYEWFLLGIEVEGSRLEAGGTLPAPKDELLNFFGRLEEKLDESGFLYPPEKRPAMVRNIRNLFQRMGLTESELRTLHGIVSALWRGRHGER